VSTSQRHLAKRLQEKGLVTLHRLRPDGLEMALTPTGRVIADQPEPEGSPLR
jgi:hypothetical protein